MPTTTTHADRRRPAASHRIGAAGGGAHGSSLRQRRDAALRIRKRRKDAMLRTKRGLSTTAGATAVDNDTSPLSYPAFLHAVDAYLQAPSSGTSSLSTTAAAFLSTLSLPHAGVCLVRCLADDESKALGLARRVIQEGVASLSVHAQESPTTTATAAAAESSRRLLLIWTSTLVQSASSSSNNNDSTKATTTMNHDEDEGYYGRAHLRWSDVLVSSSAQPNVVDLILEWLQQQQQQSATPRTTPTTVTKKYDATAITTACNILGNLVQLDPFQTIRRLLLAWPLIVSHLPHSSYCCAIVIRYDTHHTAAQFVGVLGQPQPSSQSQRWWLLSPAHLAELLGHPATATDAAWMVDGLSRKEPETIRALCRDTVLVRGLVQCIVTATSGSSRGTGSRELLVPALGAVGNLCAIVPDSVTTFSQDTDGWMQALGVLLEERSILDVVGAVGSLLATTCRVGATVDAQLLSKLLAILSSNTGRFDWKREAAMAVADVLVLQQDNDSERSSVDSVVHVLTADVASLEALVQSLVDILKVPDMDATLASLDICNFLLRSIQGTRRMFEECHGVDELERIVTTLSGQDGGIASTIAAELVDDLFDSGEEEDEQYNIEMEAAAPTIEGDQFVFGMPVSQQRAPVSFEFSDRGLRPQGRGRGRTMPAWMQQTK